MIVKCHKTTGLYPTLLNKKDFLLFLKYLDRFSSFHIIVTNELLLALSASSLFTIPQLIGGLFSFTNKRFFNPPGHPGDFF